MRITWDWKEGFRFALAIEFRPKEGSSFSYKLGFAEKFGAFFLNPLYKTIDLISKYIRKPLAICLFTMLASFLSILVFYNFPPLLILGKLFPYQAVRYLLFVYIELIFFCLGCRALGRFSNKDLVSLWKNNRLTPVFLGK